MLAASVLVLLGSFSGTTAAQKRIVISAERELPIAPIDPDIPACQQYSRELFRHSDAAFDALNACQRGDTHFGYCADGELRAWSQCCGLAKEADRLSEIFEKESRDCFDRAHARRARENAAERQREAEERAAREMRAANDAAGRARSAIGLISRPAEFLSSAFSSKMHKAVRTMLFGSQGKELKRPDIAEELYRYMHNQARAGYAAMPSNPVIRSIQRHSLDELLHYHSKVMEDLDGALAQMAALDAQDRAPSPAPLRRFPAPRRPTGKGVNPDCAILQDINASRMLLESDFARWSALSSECTR